MRESSLELAAEEGSMLGAFEREGIKPIRSGNRKIDPEGSSERVSRRVLASAGGMEGDDNVGWLFGVWLG
jgi:hypothetical protein